jgi:phosphoserine phosphatase
VLTEDERGELAGLMKRHGWTEAHVAPWAQASREQVRDALAGRKVFTWTRSRIMDSARRMDRHLRARGARETGRAVPWPWSR